MLTSMFLIFTGAAIIATLALFTRQSLLIAYIALGVLIGPSGLQWINQPIWIQQIGDMGIIFLLFLLGLHLQPQHLLESLRKTTVVAIFSSLCFFVLSAGIALSCGFSPQDSCVIGIAMMFSSTLIGLKLLPTTVLHHQHTGEIMICVLLLQDIIAIAVLIFLGGAHSHASALAFLRMLLELPLLIALAYGFQRFVFIKLLVKFDGIKEFIFLLSIGWCLGMAELTEWLGLSRECGAFIAGVVLAQEPVAQYIAESLKPLRDFFLILYFFSIGARMQLAEAITVLKPALLLAGVLLCAKPWIFAKLLQWTKESKSVATEVGIRLAQGSEFSLLVAYITSSPGLALLSETGSSLIQVTTLFTFIVSSYWVVWRYPTPIAFNERLRRD